MKIKGLAIGLLLVLTLGGGYFYAQNKAQSYAEDAALNIKNIIEKADENLLFTYESAEGNALSQSATLKKAKLKDRYSPGFLNINEIEIKGNEKEISYIRFVDIEFQDQSERVSIGEFQGENIQIEDLKMLKNLMESNRPENLIGTIGRLNTGAFSIKDFSLEETIKNAGTDDEIKIGELKIEEIKNGRITKIYWNDIEVKSSNEELEALNIENLSIEGLDLFYLTSEDSMEKGAAAGFGISSFELNKLNVVSNNMREPITLNRLKVELSDFLGELPRSNEMTLDNLIIPLAPFEAAGILPRGSMEKITDRNDLNLSMKANLDLDTKKRELKNFFEIDVKGLGKIEQKASLSNVNTKALRKLMENPNDEAALISVYFDSAFKSFSLTYDDEGLANHLFDLLLENFGDIYRMENRDDLAALAELQIRQMLGDQGQLAGDASSALNRFIKKSNHFSVKIEAIKPLLFTELAGLYASGDLLSSMKINIEGR